jgi:hypothetical protein
LESSVGGIFDLSRAIGTRRKIGRDQRETVIASGTGRDAEARIRGVLRDFFDNTGLYPRRIGRFRADSIHEAQGFAFLSGVNLDDDSARIVERDARKPEPVGEFPDEGPEPYALNDTFQNDAVSRKRLS